MKGSTAFILIGLLIIAVAIILVMGSGDGGTGQVVVIANNTNYYANQSFVINNTINNTYYIGGSVTIPFNNVTSGTGTGQYIIKQPDSGTFPFAVYRYDIDRPYFKVTNTGKIQWMQDGTNLAAFEFDPIGYYNNFYSGMAIYGTDQITPLIDFRSDDGTGSVDPQQIIIYANITYDRTVLTNQICETHKGTQVNYSRCYNSTGQVIETIGVFPV